MDLRSGWLGKKVAVPLCIIGLMAAVVLAQDNPVAVDFQIYRVACDGLVPATSARAGEVVEYQISATNTDLDTLPPGIVEIVGPVPEATSYVRDSATVSEELLLEYRINGRQNFVEAEPGNEPDNVDVLRWTLLQPLEPNESLGLRYRVQVDGPATSPAAGCPKGEGFSVISYQGRWESNTFWVIGEIRNDGTEPLGVELEAIARDSTGRLVDTATFWPASVDNIPPGRTRGIRYPVTNQPSAVRIELQIVGTQQW